MINFENIDPETVKINVLCERDHLLTGRMKDYDIEKIDDQFSADGKSVKYSASLRKKLVLKDLSIFNRRAAVNAIVNHSLIRLEILVNDINVMTVQDHANMTGYITSLTADSCQIFLRFDPKDFTHLY